MPSQVSQFDQLKAFKDAITRTIMVYKFALDAFETKIEILKEEFQILHDYNPIEHTKSRLKSFESIIRKMQRKEMDFSLSSLRENIQDIAGFRITCSFVSDIYRISDMLKSHNDLRIVEVKDYILNPKPNGYRSLHMIVELPIYMSDRHEHVYVEVQIRTVAMDFWASLEHKIFYKYNKAVPQRLLQDLKATADDSAALEQRMELLHKEIAEIKVAHAEEEENSLFGLNLAGETEQLSFPPALLKLLSGDDDRD